MPTVSPSLSSTRSALSMALPVVRGGVVAGEVDENIGVDLEDDLGLLYPHGFMVD